MQARIESSGPSKWTSCTSAVRRKSASAAGLSLEASAVISVMPAARVAQELACDHGRVHPVLFCFVARACSGLVVAADVVPPEPRDRDRLRVAFHIRDEGVMGVVDGGELLELGLRKTGLRPVEAGPAGRLAEASEDRAHRLDVAVLQRADEE
jgi:hypothetical protein